MLAAKNKKATIKTKSTANNQLVGKFSNLVKNPTFRKVTGFFAVAFAVIFLIITLFLWKCDKEFFIKTLKSYSFSQGGVFLEVEDLERPFPLVFIFKGVKVDTVEGLSFYFEYLKAYPSLTFAIIPVPAMHLHIKDNNSPLNIKISRAFSFRPAHRIKIVAEDLSLHRVVKKVNGDKMPLQAKISGKGYLIFPKDGSLSGLKGNMLLKIHSIGLIQKNLYKNKFVVKADSMVQDLLKSLVIKKSYCEVSLKKQNISTDNCTVTTNVGIVSVAFEESISNILKSKIKEADITVKNPEGMVDIYFTFNPKYKEKNGAYHLKLSDFIEK